MSLCVSDLSTIACPLCLTGMAGYEVWRGDEKLYWYDPQPHPNDPELQSTHPHHKHVPPDIKHQRIPAPGMSFDQPNLPLVIEEVQRLVKEDVKSSPDI